MVPCVIRVTLEARGPQRLGGADVACRMTDCLSPEALEMVLAIPTFPEVLSPQIFLTEGDILNLLFHLTSSASTWRLLGFGDQLVATPQPGSPPVLW